jgi:hypothetical protein
MSNMAMDEKKKPPSIGLSFKDAPPASVDAGANFSFSIAIQWPEAIEPGGAIYRVDDGREIIRSGDLPEPSAGDPGIAFTWVAPQEAGEHCWTLVIAKPGKDEASIAEGGLAFRFTTVPHATSLAVWDIPSPVIRGAKFAVKIGAKCTASCGLGGKLVEVRNENDTLMGSAPLDDATLSGTTALYWTTLTLKAPRKLGLHAWSVIFSARDVNLAHLDSSARFSFVTVAEPEHSVSVKVVNKATKTPIANAQVRLGLYRAVTDERGAAKVRVPKGEFPLVVTRVGYEMPERNIQVSKDVRVQIAAQALPEEDPFAAWTA